jgi:hypothetical protein
MKCSQLLAAARRRKTYFLVVFSLAVAALFLMPSLSGRERGRPRETVQQPHKINLSVEDGRPVAKAITLLEARYGWVITYEDPRYAYAGDMNDVTEEVRRDLDKYPKGKAPKVIVPKGGSLSFDYEVLKPMNAPLDPGVVVMQLLAAQAASANAGRFRMEWGDQIIHVIPTATKDRRGRSTPQQSILDTIVTLPVSERNGLQLLDALCAAITKATQMRTVVGTIPIGMFFQYKDKQGVAAQGARQVLVELLRRVSPERRLSWQLFYGPGTKMYVLNIHVV